MELYLSVAIEKERKRSITKKRIMIIYRLRHQHDKTLFKETNQRN